ncbi:MAG: hypothetical protein RIB84_23985 [Sneathiellaceae bacterium]
MTGDDLPRGGKGGNATATGPKGIAIGGQGGRGGAAGYGAGGGSGGHASGGDFARGGDGGDAGRDARPALGARSPLSYRDFDLPASPELNDKYGLFIPGRGGDSYEAYVFHEERRYHLNILLHLLREQDNSFIDYIDNLNPRNPQDWWDKAVKENPDLAERLMAHMRDCE